jgi:hypothetical protein
MTKRPDLRIHRIEEDDEIQAKYIGDIQRNYRKSKAINIKQSRYKDKLIRSRVTFQMIKRTKTILP